MNRCRQDDTLEQRLMRGARAIAMLCSVLVRSLKAAASRGSSDMLFAI